MDSICVSVPANEAGPIRGDAASREDLLSSSVNGDFVEGRSMGACVEALESKRRAEEAIASRGCDTDELEEWKQKLIERYSAIEEPPATDLRKRWSTAMWVASASRR